MRAPRATPTSRSERRGFVVAATSTDVSTLPDSLQRDARSRLGRLSMLLAAMATLTVFSAALGALPTGVIPGMTAIALVSVALTTAARAPELSDRLALRAALVGLVAYCVILSFAVARNRYLTFGVPGDSTWTCVLLVAFPLLVPARPRDTAIALALGAATGPLGALWVAATTDFELSPLGATRFIFSPAFSAVLGYMGARFIYRLGLDVGRAERLGNYRLVRRLGVGGMGEVWEGEHALLARRAAVKFIANESWDAAEALEIRRRFEREAAATAALRSPHTVEVFDFGVAEDGRFYYAMELLNGWDLDELVRAWGTLPPERAVYIIAQVLRSLREAHGTGLVHRDIKPANIMLCRYGDEPDFVKVLDFGLVRPIVQRDEDRLTRDNAVPGTPAYMAPETWNGGALDTRSDLYAVGCVLYYLLTGRRVFEGLTHAAQMMSHATDTPDPPSRHAKAPIPEALDELVLWSLAKRPADRMPNAGVFLSGLEAIEFETPWTADRAAQWWQQHAETAAVRQTDPMIDATMSAPHPSVRAALLLEAAEHDHDGDATARSR